MAKIESNSLRVFGLAGVASLAVLLAVLIGAGPAALVTTLILAVIEVTFSFDNAIVNAKILGRLSAAWQTAFLTIGILIAIFAVRLILPIVIVEISASLSFTDVLTLAANHPHEYAAKLVLAHPMIASFGGAFLLGLALDFFINGKHKALWWRWPERCLKKLANFWLPMVVAAVAVSALALARPDEAAKILAAGWLGSACFLALKFLNFVLEKRGRGTKILSGWAGLGLFIYLQVLDASFSLDGVIGAFAITNKVLLIAAGLGIGALFVRSMTIFMVRRGTLSEHKYLEHGAYYTIFVLAVSLLVSLFVGIPDFVTGLVGVVIIAGAIISSKAGRRMEPKRI